MKQGFNIDALGLVQTGLLFKNLQEEGRNEPDFVRHRRAHRWKSSTHLSVKVHKGFCNVRVIPRPCRINKRSDTPTDLRVRFCLLLTSLKYSERGRRQHLSQTLDVGNVLLLSGKYVNYLIKTEKTRSQRLLDPRPGGAGGVYLPCQVKS